MAKCPACGRVFDHGHALSVHWAQLDSDGHAAPLPDSVDTSRPEEHVEKFAEALRGRTIPEETRRKMSESRMGEDNPFYGKSHTEETKRKIGEAKSGENNHNYGKERSEETKRKIGEANRERLTGRTLPEEHRRNIAESLKGEKHPRWSGGPEPYGPGWNDDKKEAVRERDKWACRRCGMTSAEHKDRYGWELEVHHVVPAREFDDPEERNAVENLITLCRECHTTLEKLPLTPET